MERRIYKVVEREGKVLGLPFADFGFVVGLFVAVFFFGNVVGMFIKMPGFYYPVGILIVIGVYIGLRIANSKKHPSYLFSYISYRFLQPDQIYIKEPPVRGKQHTTPIN